jgi:L-malate glycosyltransferase
VEGDVSRIGIYLEPSSKGVTGGAQRHAAVLAEWLSRRHDVELIVRLAPFDLAELGRISQTDLGNVQLRVLNRPGWDVVPAIPWEYDLFIPFVHLLPPVCPAPRGVLMVLFPWHDKQEMWPWSAAPPAGWGLRHRLRLFHHERRWRRVFGGYQVCTANSKFTQSWIRRRWGLDSTVVYPPVLVPPHEPPTGRQNAILSAGRFSPTGNSKRQRELIQAYRMLEQREPGLAGWQYWCVGGVADNPEEQRYFEDCVAAAEGGSVQVLRNLSSSDLERRFSEAALFWHGAGYGVDESRFPQHLEHFGMATVEAMARGCVPIVMRRGGQTEVVEHGSNGFLWETVDELHEATVQCIRDSSLRARLARQGRLDAQKFSREAFISAMSALMPAEIAAS